MAENFLAHVLMQITLQQIYLQKADYPQDNLAELWILFFLFACL